MSAKEKGRYEDMTKAGMARYEREMKSYTSHPCKGYTKKEVQRLQCTLEASFSFLVLFGVSPQIKGENPG